MKNRATPKEAASWAGTPYSCPKCGETGLRVVVERTMALCEMGFEDLGGEPYWRDGVALCEACGHMGDFIDEFAYTVDSGRSTGCA